MKKKQIKTENKCMVSRKRSKCNLGLVGFSKFIRKTKLKKIS